MKTTEDENNSCSGSFSAGSSFVAAENVNNGEKNQNDVVSLTSNTNGNKSSASGSVASDQTESNSAIRAQLTKKETRNVVMLRVAVILILATVASVVSVIIFCVTNNAETDDYHRDFEGVSTKILDKYEQIVERIGSVTSIASAATMYGLDHQEAEWPFLTMSFFQQRSTTVRQLSGALYVALAPLVTESNKAAWETYVVGNDREWVRDGMKYQEEIGLNVYEVDPTPIDELMMYNASSHPIQSFDVDQPKLVPDPGPGPYLPSWLCSPIITKKHINENLLKRQLVQEGVRLVLETNRVVFGGFQFAPPGNTSAPNEDTAFYSVLESIFDHEPHPYHGDPLATVYFPVFDSFHSTNRSIVAVAMAIIDWKTYFLNLLPKSVKGITVVVENTCDGNYTYEINGPKVSLIGFGDLHDPNFSNYRSDATLERGQHIEDGSPQGVDIVSEHCLDKIHVYPTQEFYDTHNTSTPVLITCSITLAFLFTIAVFCFYDRMVEVRQRKVLNRAVQATTVVSSLFPKNIRDQLFTLEEAKDSKVDGKGSNSKKLSSFLSGNTDGDLCNMNSTIADLYVNCTVLFADVSGFTAWSSTREPEHVFVLLQTLYNRIDKIAKRMRVYKVETIGDCYVAVTGLPEPQTNHALIMAKFAWDCKQRMVDITRELESTLGPDCSDLQLRFGLHSGPVTAGVLRGDRARFQLFGDTVNTASRMESTGLPDKIHISQETADALIGHMKGHWITPREDLVQVKGKGLLQTYWLHPGIKNKNRTIASEGGCTSSHNGDISTTERTNSEMDDKEYKDERQKHLKLERLVNWMAELMVDRAKKMILTNRVRYPNQNNNGQSNTLYYVPRPGTICLDENKEIIHMIPYNAKEAEVVAKNYETMEVDDSIVTDLRAYIYTISQAYSNENPFHNFEHACHVSMSVSKLLKRIVSVDAVENNDVNDANEDNDEDDKSHDIAAKAHNYSYGLYSDHLVQFAIVVSALIHDVDHRGCSNTRLIVEEPHLGTKYRQKSVAEQNSLDIAWTVLMEERFDRMRTVLFGTQDELLRFRQLLINNVLATDIFDKEFNELRKARWKKAFSEIDECDTLNSDRKATIVMEHIIQASDVCHTMQHFQIYTKWNKLLFQEMYQAYRAGRMGTDPSTFWYEGELQFFDTYVIPLAKKLKDCKVFGVSSDEYLNYAISNRKEWAVRGQGIVEELVKEVSEK